MNAFRSSSFVGSTLDSALASRTAFGYERARPASPKHILATMFYPLIVLRCGGSHAEGRRTAPERQSQVSARHWVPGSRESHWRLALPNEPQEDRWRSPAAGQFGLKKPRFERCAGASGTADSSPLIWASLGLHKPNRWLHLRSLTTIALAIRNHGSRMHPVFACAAQPNRTATRPSHPHSARKVSTGSTEAARRAGK